MDDELTTFLSGLFYGALLGAEIALIVAVLLS
jgi:hypothetical protein